MIVQVYHLVVKTGHQSDPDLPDRPFSEKEKTGLCNFLSLGSKGRRLFSEGESQRFDRNEVSTIVSKFGISI